MNTTQIDTTLPDLGKPASGLRRVLNTPSLLIGIIMFTILILLAIFIPYLSPYNPTEQNLSAFLQPPSAAHWLGTDQLGRDLFTRLIYAARTDLTIMVLAEIIPFCTGVMLGMISGYYGKWTDRIIALITDTFIAFPFYLIVIIVAFASGAGSAESILPSFW